MKSFHPYILNYIIYYISFNHIVKYKLRKTWKEKESEIEKMDNQKGK